MPGLGGLLGPLPSLIMGLGGCRPLAGQRVVVPEWKIPQARCYRWLAGLALAWRLGPEGIINLFGVLRAGYEVAEGDGMGPWLTHPPMESFPGPGGASTWSLEATGGL